MRSRLKITTCFKMSLGLVDNWNIILPSPRIQFYSNGYFTLIKKVLSYNSSL